MSEHTRRQENNTVIGSLEQIVLGGACMIGGVVLATAGLIELSPVMITGGLSACGGGAVLAENGWHNRPQ